MKAKMCVTQCKLDPAKLFCLGCLRTIEQIAEAGRRHLAHNKKMEARNNPQKVNP